MFSEARKVPAWVQGEFDARTGVKFSLEPNTAVHKGMLYAMGYLNIKEDDLDATDYVQSVELDQLEYHEIIQEQREAGLP